MRLNRSNFIKIRSLIARFPVNVTLSPRFLYFKSKRISRGREYMIYYNKSHLVQINTVRDIIKIMVGLSLDL